MERPRKYQPLLDALAALPAEQTSLTVTFAELEELLGQPLAPSAKTSTTYWSGGSVAESNWLTWGFTGHLWRNMHTITFRRQPP